MGVVEAAWAAFAVSAASAVSSNVRANRAGTPKMSKQSIKAPSSAVEDNEKEEKVSLGSDRASSKRRNKGRRQLMNQQTTETKASTGLQI